MDRDELDARIRQRRGPETPYRRGGYADEWSGDTGGYGAFEPEPEDALAVREDATAPSGPRIDHVDDSYEPPGPVAPVVPAWPASDEVAPAAPSEWDEPLTDEPDEPAADPWRRGRDADDADDALAIPPAVPIAAASVAPDPWVTPAGPEPTPYESDQPAEVVQPDAPAYEAPVYDERAYGDDAAAYGGGDGAWDNGAYATPAYEDEPRRGGGLAVIAFVGLGALALVVGVLLSGIFNNRSGVADASPTASPTIESTTTPVPTQAATPSVSAGASGSANASEGPPIIFPDGFVAQTQACSTEPNGSGCNSDGATNDGSMWVWIG